MIVILHPHFNQASAEYIHTLDYLNNLPNIDTHVHTISGTKKTITEIFLLGDINHINKENIQALPAVAQVIKISENYQILGRNNGATQEIDFEYQGLKFNQDSLHIFAGLCAVDSKENVEKTMQALQQHGQTCTRMGAYKPRTSPYYFQGHGIDCLPYIFELAGKYGIKVIAMEVLHERHINEIIQCLEQTGNPCGVMLQIGTRNAQNFELLRAVGTQTQFPILFKRGFGITLHESLNAAEYLAHAGNHNIIFCLRGMKSLFGNPHRNFADFAQVCIIKRLTTMPVCIDPSHAIGCLDKCPDGISDIFHATAQGIISGANMVLADFHPIPKKAAVDSRQAINLEHLPWFLEDINLAREAYYNRKELAKKFTL